MKRTHKLRSLGDVAAVVASAVSISAAAKTLGVQRSTVHRWIKAGKVPSPAMEAASDAAANGPTIEQTPDQWAAKVRAAGGLDATGEALLGLALAAFKLALEETEAKTRLSAMAQFRQLVRQLQAKQMREPVRPAEPAPRQVTTRVRRTGADPRAFLMAVK